MKLTPKQVKFFKSTITRATIQVFIFLPVLALLAALFLVFLAKIMSYSVAFSYSILVAGVMYFLLIQKLDSIYENFFDISGQAEAEQELTFFQTLKLAIKRAFCKHYSREWTTTENPKPTVFLDVKAKCSDCGVENYEIYIKAVESYKIRLADDILFQRNVDKFPEFYN